MKAGIPPSFPSLLVICIMKARKSCCYILLGCVIVNYQAAATLQVPPGFESLVKGQDQQVSVSLYGDVLGLYEASVSLETIRFLAPDALIRDVERKYGHDIALTTILSSGLSGPLKRNDALSCSVTNGGGCGYINTKTIAIIYDEKNDEVNLFLPERFTPEQKKEDIFFRNAPESHSGFIHQQNLSFVGDKDYQSLSLQGNGTMGLGESSYANVDWNYNGQRYRTDSNSRITVNNAYIRHDMWKKIYLQAGQMDSRDIFSSAGGNINLGQLQTGKIVGLRIGSTQAWLNREKMPSGTPLTVFLSGNSRVDAYRSDRFLGSFYLNTGVQKLDTRNFPSGSYTVTLKIYENNHLIRTQDVPFSSLGFSEENSFQWFIQAGKLSADTGIRTNDNRQVIVGGARIPLTKSLSLTAGATVLNNVNYVQGALDWSHGFDSGPLDGTLAARVSYLHGSDGSSGNIQQVSYNDGFSLSYYRSAMSSPGCNTQSDHRYSSSGCYVSSNILLAVPVYGWNATLGYVDSFNEGHYAYRSQLQKTDPGFGDGAPWESVYMTRSRSRAWQTGLSKVFNWNGYTIGTSLNAFLRRDTSYEKSDRGGYISFTVSHASDTSSTSLNTSLNSSRNGERKLGYGASYSRFSSAAGDDEMGASVNGINTDSIDALAYRRMGGQYGNGSLTVSDAYDQRRSIHSPGISGSYSSSFAIDRQGFFWGRWGDGMPASAVTFGIESEDDDKLSRAKVSVSSGGQADIRGNSRAFFTVPGYQQTTVNISESSETEHGASSEISKGAGTKTLFMMPGKIVNNNVSVVSRYTWLGRMVDAANQPLDDVIPLNVMSWSPLGKGGFSLESTHPLKTLYVMRGDEYLQCPVTVKEQRDVVSWVGNVKCRNISFASLPTAERKQAQLMTAGIRKENNETASVN